MMGDADKQAAGHADFEPDLAVNVAGIAMRNPLMTASGTSGYGPEIARHVSLSSFGAFVTKAVSRELRKGNAPSRAVETRGGMLNAIGLANVGLEGFVREKAPYLAAADVPVIVNVVGHSVEDYVAVCARLDEVDAVDGLELNVSCPNVADGLEFGTHPRRLHDLLSEVRGVVKRCPLIVKLSPNVTDVVEMARAAIDAGVDALSAINTLRGMAIDVERARPILANVAGGLSGPAVKPVALFMVHQIYKGVARDAGVPIIGMGGIGDWRDVVEFMLAGATAVAVGTALFVDPSVSIAICDGLTSYLRRRGIGRAADLIGSLDA